MVFEYLDSILKELQKKNAANFDGIVFVFPNDKHGILGWENNGTLWIYYELTNIISSNFKLGKSDSDLIITNWFSNRLELKVNHTKRFNLELPNWLKTED